MLHLNSSVRRLARTKLDLAGNGWREVLPRLQPVPHGGWIAAIRGALGMSQSDLARRLHVRPSSAAKMESSEQAGTIQLDTLRRAADALGCELVVAMVPRQPLQAMVDQQRLKRYEWMLERTATHMSLEDQAVSGELRRHLLEQAETAIPDSALWREPASG